MENAQIPDGPQPVSSGEGDPDSSPEEPPAASVEEPSTREMTRFRTFLLIQFLFLVTSPLAGGFHYRLWSMLDTALFVLSIGICTLVFVVETKRGRTIIFRVSASLYLLGVLDMSLNILLSGILGWRGIAPPV